MIYRFRWFLIFKIWIFCVDKKMKERKNKRNKEKENIDIYCGFIYI